MDSSELMAVMIHRSQFPENVRQDLRRSLITREVNHKFHYDSVKQTNRWLALHEAVSPARRDPDGMRIYEDAALRIAELVPGKSVALASVGCGGGQKDVEILRHLKTKGKHAIYLPIDVSPAMTLVAAQAAAAVIDEDSARPVALDLATTEDLQGVISTVAGDTPRVLVFYGMLPNFEPRQIFPRLAAALRPEELLAVSANLSPGTDYQAGTKRVLSQYDNTPTREWLSVFLFDLGFEPADGELGIQIEPCTDDTDLLRIVARFELRGERTVRMNGEAFPFTKGESIRLFFSYRYTPERVTARLAAHGLEVTDSWITNSGEEGVFLCQKK